VSTRVGEVLIVDPDGPIRGLLATVVRRLPRKPILAIDAAKAIELLSSHDFDAVIMDLILAGASGSEILAYIGRTNPQLLPHVIVVTTAPQVDRSSGELASVAAVLRKPFAIDELQRVLRACCSDGKSGDQ
jgi:DNA-binding NtrC family response regulator